MPSLATQENACDVCGDKGIGGAAEREEQGQPHHARDGEPVVAGEDGDAPLESGRGISCVLKTEVMSTPMTKYIPVSRKSTMVVRSAWVTRSSLEPWACE